MVAQMVSKQLHAGASLLLLSLFPFLSLCRGKVDCQEIEYYGCYDTHHSKGARHNLVAGKTSTSPPKAEPTVLPRLIAAEFIDIIVPRNLGTCSREKLLAAEDAMLENQGKQR